MKRFDLIKLHFIRNWRLPGTERLSRWFHPSNEFKKDITNGIVWLIDEDIAIYTTADNYIEWTILSTGTYEDQINRLIRVSLKSEGVALDIGANIGLHSVRMSQSAGPQGKVYAFEPLNHLQEKFRNNIKLNRADNVKLFPLALSNTSSEVDFKIDKNSWNQGTFSIGHQEEQGSEIQRVTIKRGDELPDVRDLNRLDLIKIDVEGFEYRVLLGLKETIAKHKPRIIFEYDVNYWTNQGFDIKECHSYLSAFGYTIYQITPAGCQLIRDSSAIAGGNLFCLHQ